MGLIGVVVGLIGVVTIVGVVVQGVELLLGRTDVGVPLGEVTGLADVETIWLVVGRIGVVVGLTGVDVRFG